MPATVRWMSHYGLIRVDGSGVATAGERLGEDTLTVEVSGPNYAVRSTKEILVLPADTFRIVGVVTESSSPAVPVVAARVEVIGGAPLVAITDREGRYRLYGVPAQTDIRVTRDGYQPHVQSLRLTGHGIQNFELRLSGPRLSLAGAYTLAIDVRCSTSTPVSEDLRNLRYAAFVTQNDSALEIVLSDSTRFKVNIAGRGDRFGGRADATGATFDLGDSFYLYYPTSYTPFIYPKVVERLADGTFLVVDGTAVTRESPRGLAGELQGSVTHHASTFPAFPVRTLGTCHSSTHGFTLKKDEG